MQTVKFQFLERCGYPLRNRAGLSLTTRHILVHLKFLSSVLLEGGAGSRHLCSCRPPSLSDCFLLTADLHFRPTSHALTSHSLPSISGTQGFVYMLTIPLCQCRKPCPRRENSFSLLALPSLQRSSPFTIELPIQEAQLGSELALLRSSKV